MAHSGGGWVGKGIDAALGINLDDSTPSPSTSPTRAAPAPLLLYQSQNPSLVSFVTVQAAQPCQGYAGHLSLHEYRKYLSQPDDSTTSSELRGRTLKRKAGTLNLSQARGRRDFSSSISSSFSSVPPSSPPPLSFSQSLQSVTSNVSDPEPEILAGLSHLGQTRSKSISTISSPVSLGQRSDISLPIVMHHEQTSRTHNAFRDRLQKPNDAEPATLHRRSSSDTALGTLELPKTTFHHEGISFEMINPRDSLEFARVSSSLEDPKHLSLDSSEGRRISTVSAITVGNSGTPTMSPDHSPSNVQLEARLQRPADARRLFDDFPLAHTSGLQNLKLPSPSSNFLESSDPFITLPQSNDWHDTQASSLNLDPFPNQLEYQSHTESHNETLVSRPAESAMEDENPLPSGHFRFSSKTSLESAKSISEKFTKLFSKRSKQSHATRHPLWSFLIPRLKDSHQDGLQNRQVFHSSCRDASTIPSSTVKSLKLTTKKHSPAINIPLCRRVNRNQPNYHSARSRIEKPWVIRGILQTPTSSSSRRIPTRRAAHRRRVLQQYFQELYFGRSLSQEEITSLSLRQEGLSESVRKEAVLPLSPVRRHRHPENASYRANRFYSVQSDAVSENSDVGAIREFLKLSSPLRTFSDVSSHSEMSDIGEPGSSIDDDQDSQAGEGLGQARHHVSSNTSINVIDPWLNTSFIPYVDSAGRLDAFLPVEDRKPAAPRFKNIQLPATASLAQDTGFDSLPGPVNQHLTTNPLQKTGPDASRQSSGQARDVVREIESLEKPEEAVEERKIVESSQFLAFAGSEKTFEQAGSFGHMLEQSEESDEEEEEEEEADHQPPLPSILPLFVNKNPLLMHPAREDLAHSHHLHEDSQSGRSILVPRYYYEGDPSFPHRNAFTSPVPITLPRGNPPSSSSFSAPGTYDHFLNPFSESHSSYHLSPAPSRKKSKREAILLTVRPLCCCRSQ